MQLNVNHGNVSSASIVRAPGVSGANGNGFMTVQALLQAAKTALSAPGGGYTVATGVQRTTEEAIKTALDNANNNRTFVQSGPSKCPAPPAA